MYIINVIISCFIVLAAAENPSDVVSPFKVVDICIPSTNDHGVSKLQYPFSFEIAPTRPYSADEGLILTFLRDQRIDHLSFAIDLDIKYPNGTVAIDRGMIQLNKASSDVSTRRLLNKKVVENLEQLENADDANTLQRRSLFSSRSAHEGRDLKGFKFKFKSSKIGKSKSSFKSTKSYGSSKSSKWYTNKSGKSYGFRDTSKLDQRFPRGYTSTSYGYSGRSSYTDGMLMYYLYTRPLSHRYYYGECRRYSNCNRYRNNSTDSCVNESNESGCILESDSAYSRDEILMIGSNVAAFGDVDIFPLTVTIYEIIMDCAWVEQQSLNGSPAFMVALSTVDGSDGGLSGGAIAGIVFGIIFCLCCTYAYINNDCDKVEDEKLDGQNNDTNDVPTGIPVKSTPSNRYPTATVQNIPNAVPVVGAIPVQQPPIVAQPVVATVAGNPSGPMANV